MIRLWIIGRRSHRSCRWHRQGSAQGDRCDAVFLRRSASIGYITMIRYVRAVTFPRATPQLFPFTRRRALQFVEYELADAWTKCQCYARCQLAAIQHKFCSEVFISAFLAFHLTTDFFITWHRAMRQCGTKEDAGTYNRLCGAHQHSTEGTGCLQQANTNHSDYTYIPRRWVDTYLSYIYLLIFFLYCTLHIAYVLHFTRDFAKKRLDIGSSRDIHNEFLPI